MIGLFDSGDGGLTILAAAEARLPEHQFVYLGDHQNVPYGDRSSTEVIEWTEQGVEWLFEFGCRLVILACNTASAIACRTLQTDWLPQSRWSEHNVLGIVAPTVEAASQTHNAETMSMSTSMSMSPQALRRLTPRNIAVFGTTRTIESNVYIEEITKRNRSAHVIQQPCSGLVDAIEGCASSDEIDSLVSEFVNSLLGRNRNHVPDTAILGCTHYSIIEKSFRRFLPPSTKILSQPRSVAESLADYLHRHPHYANPNARDGRAELSPCLFTTGATRKSESAFGGFNYQPISTSAR